MGACAECGAPMVVDYHPNFDRSTSMPLCLLCAQEHANDEAELRFYEVCSHLPDPAPSRNLFLYDEQWWSPKARERRRKTGRLAAGDWVRVTGDWMHRGEEGLIIEQHRPTMLSDPEHTLWWTIEREDGGTFVAPANMLTEVKSESPGKSHKRRRHTGPGHRQRDDRRVERSARP